MTKETPAVEQRPVRMCDSCGGVDTAPRHVHGVGPGQSPTDPAVADKALANAGDAHRAAILQQILNTDTQVKHLDCCASDGCPDGSCNLIHKNSPAKTNGQDPAHESDVLRNDDLLAYLQSGAADSVGSDLNAQRTTNAQVDQESRAASLYEQEN